MAVKQHDTGRSKRRKSIMLKLFIFVQFITVAALLHKCVQDALDPHHCHNILEHGQWSHDPQNTSTKLGWNPDGCSKQEYSAELVRECLSHQDVQFRGDSTARELFWAVARRLDENSALQEQPFTAKHSNIRFEASQSTIEFIWDPYLNQSTGSESLAHLDRELTTIVGAGLWHALHLEKGAELLLEDFIRISPPSGNVSKIKYSPPRLIVVPMATPVYERLGGAKATKIVNTTVTELNQVLRVLDGRPDVDVAWAFSKMTHERSSSFQDDGLHVVPAIAAVQADLLLNRMCNPLYRQKEFHIRPSCCARPHHERSQIIMVWLLLGAFLTCSAGLMTRWWTSAMRSSLPERLYFLSKGTNAYLVSMATICAAILYCFVADRTESLSTSDKIVDVRLFLVSGFITMLCGICTITKSPRDNFSDADVYMSRAQTDEWKGWMQSFILLYHYFGMSRVLWVYQIVRCLVGAYLFLTGYGHTLYFIKTNDFSLQRFTIVLVRLNLLAGSLAWAMDTTWDFYYFPALSSFWFLIVFITLYRSKHTVMTLTEVLTRILISMALVSVVIRTGIFRKALLELASLNAGRYSDPAEAAREFEFRVKLDLLAPYAGMLFAVAQNKMWTNIAAVDTRKSKLGYFTIPSSVLLLVGFFCAAQSFNNKVAYNLWHPIVSLAPITAYIMLRNSCSSRRAHHSRIFAWLGQCSLETFVLQYHIWLAMDTKATLHLGILDRPGVSGAAAIVSIASWRYWVEKAFLTVVFLWASDAVARATNLLVSVIKGRKK